MQKTNAMSGPDVSSVANSLILQSLPKKESKSNKIIVKMPVTWT